MYIIPKTYSLGPVLIFENLASIARKHNDWRKVARLIQKMNLILGRKGSLDNVKTYFEQSRIYLDLALKDTKLNPETKKEIIRIYEG